ncbi:MAG: hypothetical protein OXC40_02440, partial [Proteobacteria bacterium]|nr:hypothetical protein [Pseudomonadota bacterium]
MDIMFFSSSEQTPINIRGSRRWSYTVFAIALLLFLGFAYYSSKELSFHYKVKALQDSGAIQLLSSWQVQVSGCQNNQSKGTLCTPLGSWSDIDLADPSSTRDILNQINRQTTRVSDYYQATLETQLTLRQLAWLDSKPNSSLLLPGFVGTNSRMTQPMTTPWFTAGKADLLFTLPKITQQKSISMSIQFLPSQKLFGSFGHSPALVTWDHIDEYANLDQLKRTLYYLQRASLVILPLLTAALVIVLDHAKTVLYVSYIGILLAGRVLLASIIEGSSGQTQAVLSYFMMILYSLSPIFFINLAFYLIRMHIKKMYLVFLALLSCLINTVTMIQIDYFFYLSQADKVLDGLGLFLAFLIIGYGLIFHSQEQEEQHLLSTTGEKASLILAMSVFFIGFMANLWDFIGHNSHGQSSLTSWV